MEFLAITAHTSKYIDIGLFGVVNLCLANNLPNAGEASDL
jgi:hypothetical protein